MPLNTFFLDLTSKGPLLIKGEELYFISLRNSKEDYILFNDSQVKLGIVPSSNLADLIRFYKHLKQKEIFSIKRNFIENKTTYGFQDAENRGKEIGDRKLFSFIIKELMPYLSGHKEDLSALLGEEVAKQDAKDIKEVDEKELLENLEVAKRNLRQEIEQYGKKQFNGDIRDEMSYFYSLMKGQDVLTLDDIIYQLVKSKKGESQLEIILDQKDEHFNLKPFTMISQIEKDYSKFLEWKAQLEAIDEFSDYIKEIQKTRLSIVKDFDKIIKLKEFNDGDIGFLRKDNAVYVYQIIPQFAMLDPRPEKKDICYEFPKCRVGMHIFYEEGRIYLDEPILFESIWHPFVSRENQEFQHLCGGHVPDRGKYSEVEWVAKSLDDAKNLVIGGLTPNSILNHGGSGNSGGNYFGVPLENKLNPRKITVEEAKKRGLLISNKWNWGE